MFVLGFFNVGLIASDSSDDSNVVEEVFSFALDNSSPVIRPDQRMDRVLPGGFVPQSRFTSQSLSSFADGFQAWFANLDAAAGPVPSDPVISPNSYRGSSPTESVVDDGFESRMQVFIKDQLVILARVFHERFNQLENRVAWMEGQINTMSGCQANMNTLLARMFTVHEKIFACQQAMLDSQRVMSQSSAEILALLQDKKDSPRPKVVKKKGGLVVARKKKGSRARGAGFGSGRRTPDQWRKSTQE